jgi:hypothetical protein
MRSIGAAESNVTSRSRYANVAYVPTGLASTAQSQHRQFPSFPVLPVLPALQISHFQDDGRTAWNMKF